jgi:DNA invertase Pin-like site-specific DNA recombinase/predicted component of type VI protein secretion system
MTLFRSWAERLTAAAGVLPSMLFYTRKSTTGEDRQAASHDQQKERIADRFGVFNDIWWFADSCTGTNFDRDQFTQLRDFCRQNRRSKSDPGKIYIYDPSRFGRVLDEDGTPDILAFLAMYGEFESAGWELHFATVNRVGDRLADIITMALYAYAAAIYSTNLSNNVKRGMANHAAEGWWTGGSAPWGTKRMDTRTGRILEDKQQSTPGGGGTILVKDPAILKHWVKLAKRIVGGASLDAVGEMLAGEGVRGPRGGNLGHRSIKNFLTNVALIGLVEYTPNGADEPVQVQAKWDALVDVELFRTVEKELAHRAGSPRNRQRKKRGGFPLKPVCAHCTGEYTGGRLSKAQGSNRLYTHTKPKKRMGGEAFDRFAECGCKVWCVDAVELEDGIKDLIARERGSADFEELVRREILQRDEFRQRADQAVAAANAEVESLDRQNKKLAQTLAILSANEDFDIAEFEKQVKPVQQKLAAARTALKDAEKFASSREEAWERIASVIDETRNLAEAWPTLDETGRKALLDYWVYNVQIVVEPIPSMKRANEKFAVVTLRSAPNDPRFFALDGQSPSASLSSDRTSSSDSTNSLDASAVRASAEPIRPSAQAACDRTNGSESESADVSTGTASGDPQLPSATATFRNSPRRFARFTGEFLNRRENSSCESPINSTSSAPCTPCLGQKADSSVICTNLGELCGHTSWQMSQP